MIPVPGGKSSAPSILGDVKARHSLLVKDIPVSVKLWPSGRLILLAEILAYNKSAVCRSASPAFSFVLFKTMSNNVATLCCSKNRRCESSRQHHLKVWFSYVGKIPDDLIFSLPLQNLMLFLHQKMSLLFFLSRSCYFPVELRWPVTQR